VLREAVEEAAVRPEAAGGVALVAPKADRELSSYATLLCDGVLRSDC
jgi:hypothetical protein